MEARPPLIPPICSIDWECTAGVQIVIICYEMIPLQGWLQIIVYKHNFEFVCLSYLGFRLKSYLVHPCQFVLMYSVGWECTAGVQSVIIFYEMIPVQGWFQIRDSNLFETSTRKYGHLWWLFFLTFW